MRSFLTVCVVVPVVVFSTAVSAWRVDAPVADQSLLQNIQTCQPETVEELVKWVTEDDADAKQKFGDAVRGGQGSYEALKDRLGHDKNALDVVTRCEAEAKAALARRGFV